MNVLILGGGGTIGSATAAHLAWRALADKIYILDRNAAMAESHAMDLAQSAFSCSRTKIQVGSWPDLADCDMLIVAAGLPASAATRDCCKDIRSLMPTIREIADALRRYHPTIPVLSMTNPLDAFNYTLCHTAGLPAKQFIALSQNDTLRFQWAVAEHLGCSPAAVDCRVIGEHGPGKIPLFSTVTVDGRPAALSAGEQAAILAGMGDWWRHFLDISGQRTAGWTSGAAAAQVVEAVSGRRAGPIACSAILEEGQGYSMGWPVYLDRGGVAGGEALALSPEEARSAAAAREALRHTQDLIFASLSCAE